MQAWLTEHARLPMSYVPTYCSHLNPVERIWGRLKDHVAAHRLSASIGSLVPEAEGFFADMTPEQALIWAA